MSSYRHIAALILAAGQSKRMGDENKLLLPYKGVSVLSHIIVQVKKAGVSRIFAVTGHEREKVAAEISRHDITIIHNDLYGEGMSSSVKSGIKSLPDDVDAVLVILGDMPGITAEIISKIMIAYNPAEGRKIIIPTHRGKRGNPLLWDRDFFSDFERLKGDRGAKTLLRDYPDFIAEVEIGAEAIFMDIDSLEAYQRLCR